MEITKNKWLNLLIVFIVIMVAVIAAVSLLSFKQNSAGVLKATLNLGSATTPAAATVKTTA